MGITTKGIKLKIKSEVELEFGDVIQLDDSRVYMVITCSRINVLGVEKFGLVLEECV